MLSQTVSKTALLIVPIAEYRYLAILNARLLQNKLPEHVREQALALKPSMLEVSGALDPPVSLEWIESIV